MALKFFRGQEISIISIMSSKKDGKVLLKRKDQTKITAFDKPRRHVVAPQEWIIVSGPVVFYLVVS